MTEQALSNIKTDINVGMDEVVTVFISKYETDLYAKKDDLSRQIKDKKKEIADIETQLIKSVDTSQYTTTIQLLNITSKCKDVSVQWANRENPNRIVVEVELKDEDSESRYSSTFGKNIYIPIDAVTASLRDELVEQEKELSQEMVDVMLLTKSVSRKEREVRGRIAEKKLNEAGYSELLNDADMLKLVQL